MQERVDFGYEEAVIFRALGSLDLFFVVVWKDDYGIQSDLFRSSPICSLWVSVR